MPENKEKIVYKNVHTDTTLIVENSRRSQDSCHKAAFRDSESLYLWLAGRLSNIRRIPIILMLLNDRIHMAPSLHDIL
jgi:hypothetical protein